MKIQSLAVTMILALTGAAHGASDTNAIDRKAHTIIEKKCTSCHEETRIKAAFTAGKDMQLIQKEMQKRGAKLSGSEQEVLGIYWKQQKK